MAGRVQSPSSINTYRQCPRKYFYQYIAKLPTQPSIHLVRGGLVHKALEEFFSIKDVPPVEYALAFQKELLTLFKTHWSQAAEELKPLATPEALAFFEHESQMMLMNYADIFTRRLEREMRKGISAPEAFSNLKPRIEQELVSPLRKVRGFVDAIESDEEGIRIMDYKTSKHPEITEAYRLQLAIYALLFEELHGERPKKVGIYFLNASERIMDVDEHLIRFAKDEIEMIHACTQSESIADYPMKTSRLCKWATGQCDFYGYCFGKEKLLKVPIQTTLEQ